MRSLTCPEREDVLGPHLGPEHWWPLEELSFLQSDKSKTEWSSMDARCWLLLMVIEPRASLLFPILLQIYGRNRLIPFLLWTQKSPQICTVILRICIGKVAWFAVYICSNFWVRNNLRCKYIWKVCTWLGLPMGILGAIGNFGTFGNWPAVFMHALDLESTFFKTMLPIKLLSLSITTKPITACFTSIRGVYHRLSIYLYVKG